MNYSAVITIDPNLRRQIAGFYVRWDLLEKSLGDLGGCVLDFDRDPTWKKREALEAYSSRELALADGERLYRDMERETAHEDLLLRKLRGSLAYLRALMGERLPLRDYLAQTTEVKDAPDPTLIRRLNDEYGALLAKSGFENTIQGREAYFKSVRQYDGHWLAEEVSAKKEAVIDAVMEFVSLTARPDLYIATAEEDRYWRAWITGDFDEPSKLRFNTHERHKYFGYLARYLTWHEIGGHALHIESLVEAQAKGEFEPLLLNLTLHSWEVFHMEGLAQTISSLVGRESLDDEYLLGDMRTALTFALTDWAQYEVEGGASITEVLHEAESLSPANDIALIEKDVRDRLKDPMLRCYGPVYFPSHQLLLRLKHLDEERRRKATQFLYRTLLPPAELTAYVSEVEAELEIHE